MFLNRDQLKSMTGAKRPKEIVAWLQQHAPGRYRLGVDGWPVVHEKVAEELFGVGVTKRAPRARTLNLEHLKGGGDGKASHEGPASP
jgi:hypothetical protein